MQVIHHQDRSISIRLKPVEAEETREMLIKGKYFLKEHFGKKFTIGHAGNEVAAALEHCVARGRLWAK